MKQKLGKIIFILLGLTLTSAALYYAFKNSNPAEIKDSITQADLMFVTLTIITIIIAWIVRAYRWKIISNTNLRFIEYVKFIFVGSLLNMTIPARIGEVPRAMVFANKSGTPVSSSIGFVFIERVFDVMGMIFYLVMIVSFIPIPESLLTYKTPILIVTVSFIMLFIAIFLTILFKDFALSLITKICSRMPQRIGTKLEGIASNILHSLDVLKNKKSLFKIFFSTVMVYFVEGIVVYNVVHSVGVNLPLYYAEFIMVFILFGVMIPAAPGGIGILESVIIITLTEIFNVDISTAQSAAILYRGIYHPTIIIIGIICFFTLKLKLKNLFKT